MTRSAGDSWDLASSVGATATMVAAARALASRETDAIIDDPYAAALVRAVGIDFFTRLLDGEIEIPTEASNGPTVIVDAMAVRTRFFDDFFRQAADTGIRQAVILASGLDSRSYRLPWPAGTTVYEIDQPEVLRFKTDTMTQLGVSPTAALQPVSVDLRDDWPAALRSAGFDPGQPSAWSAEGLLAYLPPDAQDRLFDNVTALSAPGSRLATEYHPDGGAALGERSQAIGNQWRQFGFDVNLADLFYAGERNPAGQYLTDHGWEVSARPRPELFAEYGRAYPNTELFAAMGGSMSIIATLN